MTKAEQIFKDTKRACKKYVDSYGYEADTCFARMATEELIYKRTESEIRKLIAKEYKNILIDLELEVITADEAKLETKVIKMVEETLNNSYIA